MSDTISALSITQSWQKISDISGISAGTEIVLQNVGFPGDIIEVSISASEPGVSFRGFRLDQIKSMYQIPPNLSEVWVRFTRNDDNLPPLRSGWLQVSTPDSISPYIGLPGSAVSEGGKGDKVLSVASETAALTAALNGHVYIVSGIIPSLGGAQSAAINFNLTESIIVRRCRAITPGKSGEDVEITVFADNSTGTVVSTITPSNINSCSTNTTTVTADQINSATTPPTDKVREFGENSLESPVAIGCEDGLLSIAFSRRDNGAAQEVRFMAIFEVLKEKPGTAPPQLILESDTLLSPTTEMSIYG